VHFTATTILLHVES